LGEPHGGGGRKHVGAAGEIFLDDVVLRGALELLARDALFVGQRDIEREQPGGRRVDGHGGVHLPERNALEQRTHIAEMRDGYADLADLALSQRMVAVVAGLGGQIEGDREPGLALGEVLAIERVGIARVGVTGIGAEDPGLVACPGRAGRWLAHGAPRLAIRLCGAAYSEDAPKGRRSRVTLRRLFAVPRASGISPGREARTRFIKIYNAPARLKAPGLFEL